MHLWLNEVGVGWLCRCPGIVRKPIRKRAHAQLVRETLGHSRLSSLSHCGLILAQRVELVCASSSPLNKQKQTKKKALAGNDLSNITFSPNPRTRGKRHHHRVKEGTFRCSELAADGIFFFYAFAERDAKSVNGNGHLSQLVSTLNLVIFVSCNSKL